MIWIIILVLWLIPIPIYFWLGWMELPKNSTVGDLCKLFSEEGPKYFPSMSDVFIPGINLICLPITIILLLDKLSRDCKIRIK